MTFYATFQGTGTPGVEHYAIVRAPCEDTAIKKLVAVGAKNWSVVSPSRVVARDKKLWKEL